MVRKLRNNLTLAPEPRYHQPGDDLDPLDLDHSRGDFEIPMRIVELEQPLRYAGGDVQRPRLQVQIIGAAGRRVLIPILLLEIVDNICFAILVFLIVSLIFVPHASNGRSPTS